MPPWPGRTPRPGRLAFGCCWRPGRTRIVGRRVGTRRCTPRRTWVTSQLLRRCWHTAPTPHCGRMTGSRPPTTRATVDTRNWRGGWRLLSHGEALADAKSDAKRGCQLPGWREVPREGVQPRAIWRDVAPGAHHVSAIGRRAPAWVGPDECGPVGLCHANCSSAGRAGRRCHRGGLAVQLARRGTGA